MRGGYERFDVPPGPSELPIDYWTKESEVSPTTKPRMSVCACCLQEISDRFILRVHPDMEFHASCLKCTECQRNLDESCTAFVRDSRTYCKEDYMRLFATKCSRCDQIFGRNELVMKARHKVFHVQCFSCVACDKRLNTGDEFQLKSESLYCKEDCGATPIPEPSSVDTNKFDLARPSSINTSSVFAEDDSWETCTMTSLDPTSSPPLSIRSPKSDEMTPQGISFGYNSSSSGGKKKKDKQTTRVRTVLNENQLLILKKCYAMNARPDALLKEQLVEMTGLNARVIRVWFQNKRCKDKKRQIQMRDYQVNAEKERALNHVRVGGVGPLIAAPPSTHCDNLGPPIEIGHFQQWGPHIDPSSLHQEGTFQQQSMGYTDLVPEMGFAMGGPHAPFHDYSPHLHASDLSSPSCSE